jgi:hypothetical protein
MDNDGQVLRRVWCLFEIFKTVSKKGVSKLVVLAHDVNLMGLKDIFIRLDVAGVIQLNADLRAAMPSAAELRHPGYINSCMSFGLITDRRFVMLLVCMRTHDMTGTCRGPSYL